MAYSLVGHFQSTPGSLTSTLTRTPAAGAGAFLVITYVNASAELSITSIANQASTAIPFTNATFHSWNTGAAVGFGQRVVWIPAFPAGTTAITVTLSGTPSSLGTHYFEHSEYTGLSTSLVIDAQAGQNQASAPSGSDGVTSGTATPTGAAGGAIVFSFQGSYSAFESCTAGTGFGNYVALNPNPGLLAAGALEDKRITSNAAVAGTFAAATVGNAYATQMLVIDEFQVNDGDFPRGREPGMRLGTPLSRLKGFTNGYTQSISISQITAQGVSPSSGAALLTGTGTLSGSGASASEGEASLTGTGALSAAGVSASSGDAQPSAGISAQGVSASAGEAAPTARIQAQGVSASAGEANLIGVTAIQATGVSASAGEVSLTGVGALGALGAAATEGQSTLAGTGALSGLGVSPSAGEAFLPAPGNSAPGVAASSGEANLTGSGALAAIGASASLGAAQIVGIGALTALGLSASSGRSNLQPQGLAAPGVSASVGLAQMTLPAVISGLGSSASSGLAFLGQLTAFSGSGIGASAGAAFLQAIPAGTMTGLGISASAGLAAITGPLSFVQVPNGISPELFQIYQTLRAFIRGVIGGTPPVEVILGIDNRVSMPAGPFIEITAVGSYRLATNIDTDVDGYFLVPLSTGTTQAKQKTRLEIKIDLYGPDSSDWAIMLGTLFRDQYACDALAPLCQPLYADNGRMVPLLTGEAQYLEHWILMASVQYDPITVTAQSFATTLDVVPINVDEEFPP